MRGSFAFLLAVTVGLASATTWTRAAGAAATPQEPPKPPATEKQVPSFKAGVEVVSLNVTATDPSNRYITDLAEADFAVFEDGVKQEVTYFTRTNLPIAFSLLIDTSASMEDKLAIAQQAASGFVRRLRTQDLGEIIDFDGRVELLQEFTNDKARLELAIRHTAAGGSTALFNAIYISLKNLKQQQIKSAGDIRRQAIVVLSDGEDTSSLVSFEEVLELAKRSETSIYCIGIRSRDPGGSKGFREAEYVLRQLAQETGGRVFFPSRAEELPAVYEQISEELSSQYLMAYTSKNPRRDGMWRRVVVRVTRPNTTTRTKLGYYAPAIR